MPTRDLVPGLWALRGVRRFARSSLSQALRGVKVPFAGSFAVKPGFWFLLGLKRRITCGAPGTAHNSRSGLTSVAKQPNCSAVDFLS